MMQFHISILIYLLLWFVGSRGDYDDDLDDRFGCDPRDPACLDKRYGPDRREPNSKPIENEKPKSETEPEPKPDPVPIPSCDTKPCNLEQLVTCQNELKVAVEDKKNGLSFFKQLVRHLSMNLNPLEGDPGTVGSKMLMTKERFDALQNDLSNPSIPPKDILDHFTVHSEFKPLEPSKPPKYIEVLNIPVVLITIAFIVIASFAIFLLRRLIFHDVHWSRLVVYTLFTGFLFSIPWEWYRLYRIALSKKMSVMMQNIPEECRPEGLSVWKSVVIYFKTALTFNSDSCAEYQKIVLVDPVWEVSPLQAVSASLSRFFAEPMKYFAAAFGESFRECFKEIPVQWQPFLFIGILVVIITVIISVSGIRIRTPFLEFNVNPGREVVYQPLGHVQHPQVLPPNPAPLALPQDQHPQVIPPNPAPLNRDNQQVMIQDREVGDDDQNQRGPELRRRKPPANDAEDIGVVEIGMLTAAPLAPNSNHERNRSESLGGEQEGICNDNAEGLRHKLQNRYVREEDHSSSAGSPCRNEEFMSGAQPLSKIPSESEYHSLQHELDNNKNSSPLQETESPSYVSTTLLSDESSNKLLFHLDGESSEGLVPDLSSVFSMPMRTAESASEATDSHERIRITSAPDSSTTGISRDVPETIGAEGPASTDEGFLLVNK